VLLNAGTHPLNVLQAFVDRTNFTLERRLLTGPPFVLQAASTAANPTARSGTQLTDNPTLNREFAVWPDIKPRVIDNAL